MAQYYTKPQPVDAWQYNGSIKLTELPWWVADLILHHKLGYHPKFNPTTNSDEDLFQFRDNGVWVQVFIGDWVVRFGPNSFSIVSDADFKTSFEQIK